LFYQLIHYAWFVAKLAYDEVSNLPLPSLTTATDEVLTQFVEIRVITGNPVPAIGELTDFLSSVVGMSCSNPQQTLLTDFVN